MEPTPLPAWKRRFTTPHVARLTWALLEPDRLGAITNESGSQQSWSWDRSTGERRQVSHVAVGAEETYVLPDGSGVVWWNDETGSERGRWMVTPFPAGAAAPLLPGVPDGWSAGLSLVPGGVAIGLATDDDVYRIFVALGGESPRQVYAHEQAAGVGDEWPQGRGGLSPDASWVAIRHSEHGDIERTAVRVLDTRTGEPVADLEDPGSRLLPVAWAPDGPRLLFRHERTGWEQPGIWTPATGERTDLDAGLEGAVYPEGWFPDGSVLLRQGFEGYDRLHRFDPASGTTTLLVDPGGTIESSGVRPDGDVWMRVETSERAPRWQNLAGEEVVGFGEERPPGRPYRSFFFASPGHERIQAFVVTPEGEAPFPTIVSVHGGPNWHHTDAYDEATQAYVDHGYAVVLVNYRGSTGYGTPFREVLRDGNIGIPESEDINAALDRVIADGIADPDRVCLEGWSWGGYQATLNAGLRPDRWRAVCAGIPVGDYVAAHYECSPLLRAWDEAVFGGSPLERPEVYARANPITYVDAVTAPMLMIAGEHDSRCPLGQVMVYAHALRVRGREVDVHLYPGGHHANDVEEQIRHIELTMAFFDRHIG